MFSVCVYVCLGVLAYVCVKRASHPFLVSLSLSPQFYLCVCECVCVCGVCASMVYRALCLSLCVCGCVCARVWFIVLSVYHYVSVCVCV